MPRPDQEFKGKFWADRGIDLEVARERGYLRYEKNDISTVRGHFAGLSAGQKATVTCKRAIQDSASGVRRIPQPVEALLHAPLRASFEGSTPRFGSVLAVFRERLDTIWSIDRSDSDFFNRLTPPYSIT